MTDQLPEVELTPERIGLLIDYWTAKSKSHERWPEGQGMHADAVGRVYADTISALRLLAEERASTPPVAPLPSFIRRDVERAIESALHPKGMSTHDGMARVKVDQLQYMLRLIDRTPSTTEGGQQ